jgi:hypothetical protein
MSYFRCKSWRILLIKFLFEKIHFFQTLHNLNALKLILVEVLNMNLNCNVSFN